jgi:hypothetical protein
MESLDVTGHPLREFGLEAVDGLLEGKLTCERSRSQEGPLGKETNSGIHCGTAREPERDLLSRVAGDREAPPSIMALAREREGIMAWGRRRVFTRQGSSGVSLITAIIGLLVLIGIGVIIFLLVQ